ncbi:MAG: carbohydrate ABC transporter permease [Microbacteriaceae bacterium]|nr:carbohydrate ABC transporter permease [Microbacteriaceae bacterium]MCL2796328.1 carbohydrate ABC transporter permease [Microbacteriaceae bacterium]
MTDFARRMSHTPLKPRKSIVLTIVMALMLIYTLVPLVWLIISATKSNTDLVNTFGFAFGHFNLIQNIRDVFTYENGVYGHWLLNTLIYVVAGAGGATVLSALGGYGLAKYDFPGKKAVFAIILGAVAVPGTALAVPTFLLFSKVGLTNTMWAVILPSLISPFGLYLMWVFASEAIPTELLEAARVDGSGELRTFGTISLRLLGPGIVTVALFAIVATWNNYFLPLIMLNDPKLYPLTVGLQSWNAETVGVAARPVFSLVTTGSLLAIIPIVVAFLLLQRFWQSGLSAGSVKQ